MTYIWQCMAIIAILEQSHHTLPSGTHTHTHTHFFASADIQKQVTNAGKLTDRVVTVTGTVSAACAVVTHVIVGTETAVTWHSEPPKSTVVSLVASPSAVPVMVISVNPGIAIQGDATITDHKRPEWRIPRHWVHVPDCWLVDTATDPRMAVSTSSINLQQQQTRSPYQRSVPGWATRCQRKEGR